MTRLKPLVALILASWAGSEYLIGQDAMSSERQNLPHHVAMPPTDGEPDTLEADMPARPVVLYRVIPKPAAPTKVALYHPKSEAKRLAIIRHLWRLDDGNYQIGSAQ